MATAIELVMPRSLRVRLQSVRILPSGWQQILVAVVLDGEACPMQVVVPPGVHMPAVGALVEFAGCRVEFRTVGERCRPIVRADGVREVVSDVRAA